MSPQTSPGTSTRLHPVPDRCAPAAPARTDKPLRYQLNVVASSIPAVVTDIGGWLFDLAMAGWQVRVAAGQTGPDPALRILGLLAEDETESSEEAESDLGRSGVLAVCTDRLELVGAPSLDAGHGGVTQYQLSRAARMFKSHALAALGQNPESAGPTETIGGRSRWRVAVSDTAPRRPDRCRPDEHLWDLLLIRG